MTKFLQELYTFSYIVGCCFFLVLSAYASDDDAWSLQRCIAYAQTHNITIRQTRLDNQSSLTALQQSRTELLPSLSANAQYQMSEHGSFSSGLSTSNPSQSLRYSLNAGWTVFAGPGILAGIKKSEQEVMGSNLRTQQATIDVVIAVMQAYLQALFAQETLKSAQQSLETSGKQYDRIVHLRDAGSASAIEVTQMQAQFAADNYEVTTAQNNVAMKVLELKQLLEISGTEPFILNFPPQPDSLGLSPLPSRDIFITTTLKAMPTIASAECQIEIAKLSLQKSKSAFLPTLTLSAELSASQYLRDDAVTLAGTSSNGYDPSVGMQLAVPIFDRLKTKTSVAQARISVESAQLNLEQARQQLTQTAESVYLNAVGARSRLDAAQEQVASARKSYDVSQEQYAVGMIQAVELLVQKNAFLAAQNEYMQAKYAVLFSTGLIDVYQGKYVDLF